MIILAGNLVSILKSIGENRLKKRIAGHALCSNTESGVGLKRMLEIGAISAEALSYLWMAIDANQNIIIAGRPHTGKPQLLFSLCPLIPSYEKALVFGNGTKDLSYYSNFISFVSGPGEPELRRQIRMSPSLNANRILVRSIKGKEAKELFWCANRGIPFLTTITANGNQEILTKLKGKEMNVAPNTLNMLDMIVFMSQGPRSVWSVESITEYKWLSRAEYFVEDEEAELKTKDIVENHSFKEEALQKSKAIDAYCDLNIVSKKDALQEFRKRKDFLARMLQSELDSLEYVNGYFEIK